MKVKDCMCQDVCCVKSDTKLTEVAKLMGENHIGCVPVCDDNDCICGIITDRDILLRTIACNKDIQNCPASDIMSCNVCTCQEEEEMTSAETKMAQNQIRRLPVCDENNHVIGMLTIGDLAHFDRELGKQEVCTCIENICQNDGQAKNAE